MVLEARLKSAESECLKAEGEKANVEREMQVLRGAQDQLLSKIKESQEFMEICSTFLQKNGLMANTSFISENNFDELF